MRLDHRLVGTVCAACFCAVSTFATAQSSNLSSPDDAAAFAQYEADLSAARPDGTIPGRYIVLLSEAVPRLDAIGLERQVKAVLDRVGGGEVLALYGTLLYGFAVRLPEDKAALLKALPLVESVEPDRLMKLDATPVQNNPPSWGLDRIDQESKTLDKKYYYPESAGQDAHVFIVDSGIRSSHEDFAGRLQPGISYVPGDTSTDDCNGHGTHVAGTAVGTQYGVAKEAFVYPVRVSACANTFPSSQTLSGLNWVAEQVYYHGRTPAVVNMSLGGSVRDATMERYVRRLVTDFDTSVVVAAGNETVDACLSAPGAEPKVLTVAASDSGDRRASYSNYGSCVDLFAPGSGIVSASYQSDSGSATMNGTSMAAPHVAGVMAIHRGLFPTTSAEVMQNGLRDYHSAQNKISDPKGSPNRLLQVLVDKPPKAAFSWNCSILTVSRTCQFDASASSDTGPYGDTDSEDVVSYSWNFGDGSTGTGKNVTHTYSNTLAQYAVTLTVTDNAQQTGSTTQNVLNVGVLP